MSRRGQPVDRDDPQGVAGLTERRIRRGEPVGGEGFDIEKSLGEDICECGLLGVKGSRCQCGRIVGKR
jgi:hypothetical protein